MGKRKRKRKGKTAAIGVPPAVLFRRSLVNVGELVALVKDGVEDVVPVILEVAMLRWGLSNEVHQAFATPGVSEGLKSEFLRLSKRISKERSVSESRRTVALLQPFHGNDGKRKKNPNAAMTTKLASNRDVLLSTRLKVDPVSIFSAIKDSGLLDLIFLVKVDDPSSVASSDVWSRVSLKSRVLYVSSSKNDGCVWFCGGFRSRDECDRVRKSTIAYAVRRRKEGAAFPTVYYSLTEAIPAARGLASKSRLSHLFSNIPEHLREKLRLDAVATYSLSDDRSADVVTQRVLALPGVDERTAIVEGTACVGGNAYSFAKRFRRVVAIELNTERYRMLTHNMGILGVADRVYCINGDCTDIIHNFSRPAGVIFLDPPWGGADYKDCESREFYLGERELSDVIRKLLSKTRYFVLKLPFNAKINKLRDFENAPIIYDRLHGSRVRLVIMENVAL